MVNQSSCWHPRRLRLVQVGMDVNAFVCEQVFQYYLTVLACLPSIVCLRLVAFVQTIKADPHLLLNDVMRNAGIVRRSNHKKAETGQYILL